MYKMHQIPSPMCTHSPTYSPATYSPAYPPISFMDEKMNENDSPTHSITFSPTHSITFMGEMMDENDNDVLITFCKIVGSKDFLIAIEDNENNAEKTEDEPIIVNPFQNLLEEIKKT